VLAASGSEVTLLSGGLRDAILPLAEFLDIPAARVHAVSLRYDADGTYESLDGEQPLATQRGKPATLFALGLPRPLVMVGDGSTDAAVRGVSDTFIAYTGVARRPNVVAVADAEARDFSTLHDLLLRESA
jgi:phosphoserine phosphatase